MGNSQQSKERKGTGVVLGKTLADGAVYHCKALHQRAAARRSVSLYGAQMSNTQVECTGPFINGMRHAAGVQCALHERAAEHRTMIHRAAA
jgi:hypothetical protein